MGCAAHPAVNNSLDYRGYTECEPEFECGDMRRFAKGSDRRRSRKVDGIVDKFDGSADFSVHMCEKVRR